MKRLLSPTPARATDVAWRPCVLPIVLALAALPACHQHLTGSGFLGTYLDMKQGRSLEAESHVPGLRFTGRGTLVVRPVRPYLLASGTRASVERLGDVLQAALVREIGRAEVYGRVIESDARMPPAGADFALDAVITEVETGRPDEPLRPGGGALEGRRISVEGKIEEIGTGRVVFKFKDTRSEVPRAGRGSGEAEAEGALERDLDAIARNVADTLREIRANAQKAPGGARGADHVLR